MVRIDRVYTGGGDAGQTSLVDGSRVSKSESRLEVVGTIDELNSLFGVISMEVNRLPETHADGGQRSTVRQVCEVTTSVIGRMQHELFDLGAELSCPPDNIPEGIVLLGEGASERLVDEMDAWLEELSPLTSFILPAGEAPVAWLQVARTVGRRLERRLVELKEKEGEDSVRAFVLSYVNRLSDWLFVLARWITMRLGESEVLWQPVGERDGSGAEGIRIQRQHGDIGSAIDDL
jgi:cob(I)alamin adenosyltransferase